MWNDFDTRLYQLLDSKCLRIVFLLACFQALFLLSSESTFQRSELPNRGFRMESIATIDFLWKSFLTSFGMDCYRFLEALGAVFLIF